MTDRVSCASCGTTLIASWKEWQRNKDGALICLNRRACGARAELRSQ